MAEFKTLGPFYIPVPVTPIPWYHEIVMRATALAYSRSMLAVLDRWDPAIEESSAVEQEIKKRPEARWRALIKQLS